MHKSKRNENATKQMHKSKCINAKQMHKSNNSNTVIGKEVYDGLELQEKYLHMDLPKNFHREMRKVKNFQKFFLPESIQNRPKRVLSEKKFVKNFPTEKYFSAHSRF